MKFTAGLAVISIASASAFAPGQSTARSNTELYKYSPTKWTPEGGSNPTFGAPVSSYTAAPTPVEEAPVSSSSTATIDSASKKNYSPTHWSPQSGATGGALWGADAADLDAVAPISSTYVKLADSFAASSTSVEKKNYSPTHWSPQGGATGGALWGADAPAPAADYASAAPAASNDSSPAASFAASSGTESKKGYAPTHWSPQGGATGSALWGAAAVPSAASASAEPVSSSFSASVDSFASISTVSKNDYSPTHWTPQGGATGGAGFA